MKPVRRIGDIWGLRFMSIKTPGIYRAIFYEPYLRAKTRAIAIARDPRTSTSANCNSPTMATFSEHPPLPSTSWDILITGSGVKQSLLAVYSIPLSPLLEP